MQEERLKRLGLSHLADKPKELKAELEKMAAACKAERLALEQSNQPPPKQG